MTKTTDRYVDRRTAARVLGLTVRQLQARTVKGTITPALVAPGYNGAHLWDKPSIERAAKRLGVQADWSQVDAGQVRTSTVWALNAVGFALFAIALAVTAHPAEPGYALAWVGIVLGAVCSIGSAFASSAHYVSETDRVRAATTQTAFGVYRRSVRDDD